jgi:hypothetical protein
MKLCDVKNIYGERTDLVSCSRLVHMNWPSGTVIEARFQKKKLFYRAVIVGWKLDTDGVQELYTVKYESDGFIEKGIYERLLLFQYINVCIYLNVYINIKRHIHMCWYVYDHLCIFV